METHLTNQKIQHVLSVSPFMTYIRQLYMFEERYVFSPMKTEIICFMGLERFQ